MHSGSHHREPGPLVLEEAQCLDSPPRTHSQGTSTPCRTVTPRIGSSFHEEEADGSASGSPISSLGRDHLGLILQLLPVRSVVSFGMTCKKAGEAVSGDSIWAAICLREWGPEAKEAEDVARRVSGGWKQIYREMTTLGAASWQQVPVPEYGPGRRASFAMSFVSDRLVIYAGGADGGRHLDDTWTADPTPLLLPGGPLADGLSWQHSATGIPPGRFGYSSTVLPGGTSLLVFGGINDLGLRLNDVWVGEVPPLQKNARAGSIGSLGSPAAAGSSVVWKELKVCGASPQARGAQAGCYAGGMRFVIYGGIALDTTRFADTWLLDLESDMEAETSEDSRNDLNGCANLSRSHAESGDASSGESARLMKGPRWTCIASEGPAARSGHTMTWLGDGKIVMFGGRNAKFEMLSDVWLLDLSQPEATWRELWSPEMFPGEEGPGARTGHSATPIFGKRVLIVGGEDANRKRRNDVWVMDPAALGIFKADNLRSACETGDDEDGLAGLLDPAPVEKEDEVEVGVVPADGGWKKPARKMWWKLTNVGGMPFKKRSFQGACRVGGAAVCLYGGMVDGELMPRDGGGLRFDDDMWLLQFVHF